jgi:carbon-monoxide dehydrogenase medium subunit
MINNYYFPNSVIEALAILKECGGKARIVAGGTDLMLQINSGERSPEVLVDISRMGELKQIKVENGYVFVGAALTHNEIAASTFLQENVRCLSLAADEVGSPQVRNSGTIGGNVINAQPAADTALALTALDAEAEIVTEDGSISTKIPLLYEKPGVSKVDSTSQIVKSFSFKLPGKNTGTAYRRLGKCKSIALPVLCSAAVLGVTDNVISYAAIALGPVALAPMRAKQTEAFLLGKKPTHEVFEEAAFIARSESNPRDSILRCSKMYRKNLVAILVKSTLQEALLNISERNI